MRWIPFAIFCYLAAAFQSTHLGLLRTESSLMTYPMPEYLILIAVFYAMYASDDAAVLVGLICGILLDLLSSSIVGTLAIPLALTCFVILKIRLSVFRENPVSQGAITALAILAFACLAFLLRWILVITLKADPGKITTLSFIWGYATNALYTGLLAPLIFWLLLKMESLLGFGLRGPRTRGH